MSDSKELAEEREAIKLSVFGYTQTKFFLSAVGLSKKCREITAEAFKRTGRYSLPFDLVLEQIPELPVYLAFRRLGSLHLTPQASFPSLFNQFKSSPIYREYKRLSSENSEIGGRVLGLVFPRNRIVRGMILHNGDPGMYCLTGTIMIIQDPDLGTLLLQRFKDFAAAVVANKQEW